MAIAQVRWLFLMVFFYSRIHVIVSLTDHGDAMVLQLLKSSWRNTPANWNESDDPCGLPWMGVTCANSRVTSLVVPAHLDKEDLTQAVSLEGQLIGKIGDLTQLTTLSLFGNNLLTGSLTPRLGNLNNLVSLNLGSCSFTGNIPEEIGNLAHLSFLSLGDNNLSGKIPAEIGNLAHLSFLTLTHNKLTGKIPPSLGKLSKLESLELADNQFSGPLPVSTENTPGLDLLLNAKKFDLGYNKLTGPIPSKLFSSNMVLDHIDFCHNQLSGKIPTTLWLVQTLTNLNLNGNAFSGAIPSTISNLVNLQELRLAQNILSGALPDLSKMTSLSLLSLGINSFDTVEAPAWFSTLPQSLTTLLMANGSLHGPLPTELLSLPMIREVDLRNNAFNGTLTIGGANISSQLDEVNLENNKISSVTLESTNFKASFKLNGNPICEKALSNTIYCFPSTLPYTTSLQQCGNKTCPSDQELLLSPNSCTCASPLQGILYFPSPLLWDYSYVTNYFHSLEVSLSDEFGLSPGSVYLMGSVENIRNYLGIGVDIALFPSKGIYFTKSDVARITTALSNHTYKPPQVFGANYTLVEISPYHFEGGKPNI